MLTFKVDGNQFQSITFTAAEAYGTGSIAVAATSTTGASVTAANDDGNTITAAWRCFCEDDHLTTAASWYSGA